MGSSSTMERAGLSSRKALKAAWRSNPFAVTVANSTSATSFGSTQWMFLVRGGFAPAVKGELARRSFASARSKGAEFSALKPVPMRPRYTKSLPRQAPARRERNVFVSPHQPPIAISCPPRHFALVHRSLRPER
jgi:hypothetical protein